LFQSLQDTQRLPWCVRRGSADLQSARVENPHSQIESTIRRLILTASGGPFANRPDLDFSKVTVDDALNHPRWKMGPKVTIDSATMMNKGLEILEARWLFNIPVEQIDVLIHPESIIHSLVEFEEGAMMAQLGMPDMRIAIQYAMTWPERPANATLPRLDLAQIGRLNFREPDYDRFPCLRIAKEVCRMSGTAATVMNAANEVAVSAFLDKRIPFSGIWKAIEAALSLPVPSRAESLEEILAVDAETRRRVKGII